MSTCLYAPLTPALFDYASLRSECFRALVAKGRPETETHPEPLYGLTVAPEHDNLAPVRLIHLPVWQPDRKN